MNSSDCENDTTTAIYQHPLFPLLAYTFENCEELTNSTPNQNAMRQGIERFQNDVTSFLDFVKITNPLYVQNPEVDSLMLCAISQLRFHLFELDQVQMLCDKFCTNYRIQLDQNASTQSILNRVGCEFNFDVESDSEDEEMLHNDALQPYFDYSKFARNKILNCNPGAYCEHNASNSTSALDCITPFRETSPPKLLSIVKPIPQYPNLSRASIKTHDGALDLRVDSSRNRSFAEPSLQTSYVEKSEHSVMSCSNHYVHSRRITVQDTFRRKEPNTLQSSPSANNGNVVEAESRTEYTATPLSHCTPLCINQISDFAVSVSQTRPTNNDPRDTSSSSWEALGKAELIFEPNNNQVDTVDTGKSEAINNAENFPNEPSAMPSQDETHPEIASNSTPRSSYMTRNKRKLADKETPTSTARKRLSNQHPPNAIEILRSWFKRNRDHPYATQQQTLRLVARTGLTKTQILKWLSTARYRSH